jgi:pimeloyl-ACP methyl ester carboxylesterase
MAAALAAAATMAISFDPERLHQQIRPFSVAEPFVPGDAEQTYFHFYGLDFERRMPGVSHYFGHFSSGKYDIVAHYFSLETPKPTSGEPPNEAAGAVKSKGTCFIFHGYFDHSGLYANLIEYCLRRNLNVVIYDLAGHGLSTGERVSIPSFSEYVSVMKDALKFFGDIAPQPWHAIGQSTGGAMLMDYMLQELAPGFDKVVPSGAGFASLTGSARNSSSACRAGSASTPTTRRSRISSSTTIRCRRNTSRCAGSTRCCAGRAASSISRR